jgi:hypothetical protein
MKQIDKASTSWKKATQRPNIIQAINNPKLFGALPRLQNLCTWASWMVVLKSIFGLPMTADELVIFSRHTGRTSPPKTGSKETISSSADVAVNLSSLRGHLLYSLLPGLWPVRHSRRDSRCDVSG